MTEILKEVDQMQWFNLPLMVALALLVGVVVMVRRRAASRTDDEAGYELNERLLSAAQCDFLEVLEQAVGADHRIMVRVPVADVVSVGDDLEGKAWQRAAERLLDREFSFLVCTRGALEPVCAVELDEPVTRPGKAAQRDLRLDAICEQAGLPLLRVPAQASHQVADIGLQFDALFEVPATALTGLKPEPELPLAMSLSARPDNLSEATFSPVAAAAMACPECGAPMVLQPAARGTAPEQRYWACSLAPACRQRLPVVRRDDISSPQLEGLVP
jgi:hypothetical protein